MSERSRESDLREAIYMLEEAQEGAKPVVQAHFTAKEVTVDDVWVSHHYDSIEDAPSAGAVFERIYDTVMVYYPGFTVTASIHNWHGEKEMFSRGKPLGSPYERR